MFRINIGNLFPNCTKVKRSSSSKQKISLLYLIVICFTALGLQKGEIITKALKSNINAVGLVVNEYR